MAQRERASDYAGNCGGERIQRAVDAAADGAGPGAVVVGPVGPDESGQWKLEQAVELPTASRREPVGRPAKRPRSRVEQLTTPPTPR